MLKPLNDNIVLKKEKFDNKTVSGIVLTGEAKEMPSIAMIVAVGDGRIEDGKRIPVTVNVGQKVVFKKYSTTEFKYDDEEYLIISEEDILAIIE